jgi:hypothetical protein
MSTKLLLLVIMILIVIMCLPQSGQAQPRGWERFYEEELDYYVQFGLENGMNVSWAHRFKNDYYIRYGADVGITESSTDDKYFDPDTTRFKYYTGDTYSVTMHADFIKPVKPYEAVRLYIGAGPFVGYSWNNNEQATPVDPSLGFPSEKNIRETKTLRVGARALVGGEYALNSRLSFFAEASLDGYAYWSKLENSYDNVVYNSDSDTYSYESTGSVSEGVQFRLDTSGVRIGVTFRYGKDK